MCLGGVIGLVILSCVLLLHEWERMELGSCMWKIMESDLACKERNQILHVEKNGTGQALRIVACCCVLRVACSCVLLQVLCVVSVAALRIVA